MTKTLTHSIKCGSCKGSHETVADVKACYAAKAHRHSAQHTTFADPVPPLVQGQTARPHQPGLPALYDGIYSIDTGARHYTFKVYTNADDSEFAPGETVVSYLRGRDNEGDYKGCGFLYPTGVRIWKRFLEQPSSSGMVEALRALVANPNAENVVSSIHCRRCHRLLTVPASVHNGLGPECARKVAH